MHQITLLDISLYLPVILKIILLIALLYIPLPIALWIYRRRKEKVDSETKPEDFVTDGTFQGFKITARGSVALYFILFIACLSSSIPIITSIDKTQDASLMIDNLKKSKDSLLSHTPWKLQYCIRLMTDSIHDADDEVYKTCLDYRNFHSFPPALSMNSTTHVVTCYIDDEIFQLNNNNYRVNIDNFNSGFELHIKPELKQNDSRSINLKDVRIIKVPESVAPYAAKTMISESMAKLPLLTQ